MKIKVFNFPNECRVTGIEFYYFLYNFVFMLKRIENTIILIDFSKTVWVDPSVCSILQLIIDKISKKNKLIIKLNGLSEDLEKIFLNNHFLKSEKRIYRKKTNVIRIGKIQQKSSEKAKIFLEKELKGLKLDIKNNKAVRELVRCILEIYKNAYTHGESFCVYICGHYFPETKSLILSISNLGETFKSNYKKNNYEFSNNVEAIGFSLKKANTSRKENETGGLGLKYVYDFIDKTNGELSIFSGDGLYVFNKNKTIFKKNFKSNFFGTMVSMRIDLQHEFFSKKQNQITLIKEISLDDLLIKNI